MVCKDYESIEISNDILVLYTLIDWCICDKINQFIFVVYKKLTRSNKLGGIMQQNHAKIILSLVDYSWWHCQCVCVCGGGTLRKVS